MYDFGNAQLEREILEREIKEKKSKGFWDLLSEPFVFFFIVLGGIWLVFGFRALIFMGILLILTNLNEQ